MTDPHAGPGYSDDQPDGVPDTSHRALMWGPANFSGMPPRRLMVEGVITGVGLSGLIVGSAVVGALTDHRLPALVAGIVVALGTAVYLFLTNAGRVLLVAVALLGAVLSWWAPRVTAEHVMAARGERRTVVVTEVHAHRYEGRDYVKNSCAVALPNGTPVEAAEAWRTCTLSTKPGDHLSMVFDPEGVFEPTDRKLPDSAVQAGWPLAGLALLLAGLCCVAVVRSQP